MNRNDLIAIAINERVWSNEGELHNMLDILEPLIRTDERERIAAAIEAERIGQSLDGFVRIKIAARIARNGGSDE